MRRNFLLLLLIGVLFMTLAACQTGTSYQNLSPAKAKDLINNEEVVVLDVRTDDEFKAGHIPNAILIPVQQLADRVDELDKEQAYLVVCRSGNRSVTASEMLLKDGFKNIYNLDVGMNGWTYEIEAN